MTGSRQTGRVINQPGTVCGERERLETDRIAGQTHIAQHEFRNGGVEQFGNG